MGLWGNSNPDDVSTKAGWDRYRQRNEEERKETRRKVANIRPTQELGDTKAPWRRSSTWPGRTMSEDGATAPKREPRKRGLWS